MRRFIASMLAIMLLAVPAFAQKNSARQKKELEKLRTEIAELDRQIKANDSKSADASAKLSLTRKKIETSKKLVNQAGKDLDSLRHKTDSLEADIRLASGQLDTTKARYASLVRKSYLDRDTRSWFVYILAGKSLSQTVRRAAYMKEMTGTLRAEARLITEKKASLEADKMQLDTLKLEYESVLAQRSADLSSLKADEKKEKTLVDNLKKDQAAYQKKLAKKQKEADALNKKIAELVAAEAKSSSKKGSSTKKGGKSSPKNNVDMKLSASFVANKGKLPWPVSGTIVGQYGQHNHPVYKNVALPFNNGVNIATSADAVVKAVFDGEVRQVVVMPGYNQCVLIQHGEYYTFYCKLKDVAVKAGDKVKTGTILGHVDTIQDETQLHFQVWKGTASQDPEIWLR